MTDGKDDGQEHIEHDFTGPLSPPVALFLKVFMGIAVVLFLLDFVVKRKIHLSAEKVPGFYAIYGFVGCVILVLVAKEMRKIVMRDETYYDRTDDDSVDGGGDA